MSSSSLSQTPSAVMQEQVLQARLGNVDVAQLYSGGDPMVDDLGDQRAAAIGVEIDAGGLVRARLGDSGQRFQPFDQSVGEAIEAQAQHVAAGDRGLQLRRR